MEIVSEDFANYIHSSNTRPFSQEFHRRDQELLWTIKCLDAFAYEQIVPKVMADDFDNLYLRQKDVTLEIKNKAIEKTDYDELFHRCYIHEEAERYIPLTFTSPTAFKSAGQYINMPTPRLIFQSLINKYDATSVKTHLGDDDLLEELEFSVSISRYRLRSIPFYLEGVSIPAFVGDMVVNVKGNPNMARLAKMLLLYGEYSGVGIKTAIGMGAIQVNDKRNPKNDTRQD